MLKTLDIKTQIDLVMQDWLVLDIIEVVPDYEVDVSVELSQGKTYLFPQSETYNNMMGGENDPSPSATQWLDSTTAHLRDARRKLHDDQVPHSAMPHVRTQGNPSFNQLLYSGPVMLTSLLKMLTFRKHPLAFLAHV
ncbi:hypothetical protein QR680_003032 [Steinernema hermaphroditum]|uniref:Uncharacterized protein n=1 Tax=Steinernema hermaphroditum TaxID=289476 RepID=A0AA39LJJ1_9BILA|nr:hypothetical protein QR680_003032 [Steinernema hermaphroditum]